MPGMQFAGYQTHSNNKRNTLPTGRNALIVVTRAGAGFTPTGPGRKEPASSLPDSCYQLPAATPKSKP